MSEIKPQLVCDIPNSCFLNNFPPILLKSCFHWFSFPESHPSKFAKNLGFVRSSFPKTLASGRFLFSKLFPKTSLKRRRPCLGAFSWPDSGSLAGAVAVAGSPGSAGGTPRPSCPRCPLRPPFACAAFPRGSGPSNRCGDALSSTQENFVRIYLRGIPPKSLQVSFYFKDKHAVSSLRLPLHASTPHVSTLPQQASPTLHRFLQPTKKCCGKMLWQNVVATVMVSMLW